ncbi:hypothetical protein [Burkholderia sp. RF2-non_BP3]|uniref:hypothetical protein n=1 Tax=Burkholderia sp. RF2-non_BP3 TaxID=1637844 RepID=UPI000A68A363|nr:hypothetical protein [Burkholderia sp. RF2-non_BP3]
MIETVGARIGVRDFIARVAMKMKMEMAACEGKVRATDVLRQDADARRMDRPPRLRRLPRDSVYCAVDRA